MLRSKSDWSLALQCIADEQVHYMDRDCNYKANSETLKLAELLEKIEKIEFVHVINANHYV